MKYRLEPVNERNAREKLADKIDNLAVSMEKMRLAEYVQMLDNPRRLLYISFLQGMFRGFGAAIGFTILAGIVLYFMQKLILINIPVIGEFIADVIEIVQLQLKLGGTIIYFK